MHISEGFLPWAHSLGWTVASTPFLIHSIRAVSRKLDESIETKLSLAAAAGFLFALSALKLPSFAGTCSHAVGVALGAILLGPRVSKLFFHLSTGLRSRGVLRALNGPVISMMVFLEKAIEGANAKC